MTNNSDNAHNPLLAIADASDALPDFAAIRAEHAEPALDAVLADNRARIQQLLKDGTDTWETLAEPLETLEERVHRVFGPVAHLFMVCSTPEWRAAYNACLPKLTDYAMELGQSRPLFEAWQRLRDSADFERLDTGRLDGCTCETCLVNIQAVALNTLTAWYVRSELLLQDGEWPDLINQSFPSRESVDQAIDKAITKVRENPKEIAHRKDPAPPPF